jgi:hypothetical protein
MRLSPRPALIALLAAGCGGGGADTSPIAAPSYNAYTMADAAMKKYDKNGDGKIAGPELDACPSLKNSLLALDTDKDKGIGWSELQTRFTEYTTTGIGAVSITCTVRASSFDVTGATVTFTPEDFMGPSVSGGTATLDKSGIGSVGGGGGLPGLPCGFYRVSISKKDGSGKELVPTKYAAGDILGVEISGGRAVGGGFVFTVN